jgi:microcystin-dependent protein
LNCNATNGNNLNPLNNFWAAQPSLTQYAATSTANTMKPTAISSSGGNQPHDNMVPYLTINYLIALEGIYPSRN